MRKITKMIGFWVDPELHERLQERAQQEEMSLSDMLRRISWSFLGVDKTKKFPRAGNGKQTESAKQ